MEQSIEIWKDVEGFEGSYQVSNLGRVKNVCRHIRGRNDGIRTIRERIRIQRQSRTGYCMTILSSNNKQKNCTIHRLVALSFVENPNNYTEVNHIDGDKMNNRADNLEWCTRSENNRHAIRTGLRRHNWTGMFGSKHRLSKPVTQRDLNGKYINVFESTGDAERKTGVSAKGISRIAIRKKGHAGGFAWSYE